MFVIHREVGSGNRSKTAGCYRCNRTEYDEGLDILSDRIVIRSIMSIRNLAINETKSFMNFRVEEIESGGCRAWKRRRA